VDNGYAPQTWSGMLDAAIRAAWRMTRLRLFRPFELDKWLVLGLAAWIVSIGGAGAAKAVNLLTLPARLSAMRPSGSPGAFPNAAQIMQEMGAMQQWLQAHLFAVVFAAVFLLILYLVLWLLFLWLGARARFMFLDGVVTGRPTVRESWRKWRDPANSAFLWLLVFRIVRAFVLPGMGIACLAVVLLGRSAGLGFAVLAAGSAAVFVPAAAGFACTAYFFDAFVVPLMYRYGLRAGAAWRVFLDILRPNWPGFLLYVAVVIFLWLGAILGVVIACALTCCIGLLVLAVPYVGTVVLLPVTVYFRLLSLYFLQQFHGDFRLLPDPFTLPEETQVPANPEAADAGA